MIFKETLFYLQSAASKTLKILKVVMAARSAFLIWLSAGQANSLKSLLHAYTSYAVSVTTQAARKLSSASICFNGRGLLKLAGVLAATAILALILAAISLAIPDNSIPEHQPVSRIVFLDQGEGWNKGLLSRLRQEYYFTPQGTSLSDLRYSWFVSLERAPDRTLLADPKNMSKLGFLVDAPTPRNPDSLPVGFTRRFDSKIHDYVVDITCAACHTGQIDVTISSGEHVGIRIDGGQAMHAFAALDKGQFGASLLTSMLATAINPLKFHRFATRVLHPNYMTSLSEIALFRDFVSVLGRLAGQAEYSLRHHLSPVAEGYGRVDAVGRIANHVFGYELDSKNYHPANAPVSYPALWDIWKFDWVQYTASVSQPLARNIGETLGVGADLSLRSPYGQPLLENERYVSSASIPNLVRTEANLQTLKAPKWPNVLGSIDLAKANSGRVLYEVHCAKCHQPCEMSKQDRAVLFSDKFINLPHWHLSTLPVEVIGTDPTAAMNFVNNKYDLSKTGLTVQEVRNEIENLWKKYESRLNKYRENVHLPPIDMDGYINDQLALVNVKSATVGQGLNYIGMHLQRKYFIDEYSRRATCTKELSSSSSSHGEGADTCLMTPQIEQDIQEQQGFGALDLPAVKLQYKARPLDGVWATPPYLHNGSVPTLYEMLVPADQRRKRFFVGRREFDLVRVGLSVEPLSESGFWLDTSIQGNWNIGHEFRKGYSGIAKNGVIGPELQDSERWAIIEYLKVLDNSKADNKPPVCSTDYSWDEKEQTIK